MHQRWQANVANLRRFPRNFWVLLVATFIDRLGGALLLPFFALYITARFNVSMLDVGGVFITFAGASFVGSLVSGIFTDRLGRRWMLLFGLVMSALTSLLLGLVDSLLWFHILAGVVGLLANTGGPAQSAMVADLLPPELRAEGYGLSRIAVNLAFAIGPAIGGLLADQSYLLLFIFDALTSLITAVIVFFALPETKPAPPAGGAEPAGRPTDRGYGTVLRDRFFMAVMVLVTLTAIVYFQIHSTLSVFLRDVHGLPTSQFGLLLSLNAGLVIVFQFGITRRASGHPPLAVIAAGVLLYGLGFGLFGFVTSLFWFAVAIAVLTGGEMIVTPIVQALVAGRAPEHMRGRYLAVFSIKYLIATGAGPLLGGLIMARFDPRWVWYACGIVCGLVALGYLGLASRQSRSADT